VLPSDSRFREDLIALKKGAHAKPLFCVKTFATSLTRTCCVGVLLSMQATKRPTRRRCLWRSGSGRTGASARTMRSSRARRLPSTDCRSGLCIAARLLFWQTSACLRPHASAVTLHASIFPHRCLRPWLAACTSTKGLSTPAGFEPATLRGDEISSLTQ
jgi:hypothetical protein